MAANTDENENHWPGYVDALTTMTMVLTFVMMVLGIAIFALSQNVSRGMIDMIANALKVPIEEETSTQEELAQRIVARIDAMAAEQASGKGPRDGEGHAQATPPPPVPGASPIEGERITSQAAAQPELRSTPLRIEGSQETLRISYLPRASQLDDSARTQLLERLKAIPNLSATGQIEVIAGLDAVNIAVSDTRRIAFYRAMRARGELMQAGITADRIKVRIDQSVQGDDVLIVIKP